MLSSTSSNPGNPDNPTNPTTLAPLPKPVFRADQGSIILPGPGVQRILRIDSDLGDVPINAPVFGSRTWLEATRRAHPFPLEVLKLYAGDALAAYLPLQTIRRGGLVKAFVPIQTFYGGPYFLPGPRRRFDEETRERNGILSAMLAWLEQRTHYCFLLPEGRDVRPALDRNWRSLPRYTVLNRLREPDSLEGNKDYRANLRKAEKAGLSFGPVAGEDRFAEAYARTFRRKGLAMKWKPEWASDLRRELTGMGLMENWAVRDRDGEPVAFGSMAPDPVHDTVILWCACSLERAERNGAMHFLYRNLLLQYRERYGCLDFCGADDRSLSVFKEKFANRMEFRYSLEKYRGPVSKGLIKGYEVARGALAGS